MTLNGDQFWGCSGGREGKENSTSGCGVWEQAPFLAAQSCPDPPLGAMMASLGEVLCPFPHLPIPRTSERTSSSSPGGTKQPFPFPVPDSP